MRRIFSRFALTLVGVFFMMSPANAAVETGGETIDAQATKTLRVVVKTQNNTPVNGIAVDIWSDTAWDNGTTNSSGVAEFTVEDDGSYWYVNVYDFNGDYTSQFVSDVELTSATTTVNVEVLATDATINATLRDSDGDLVTLGDTEFGSVNCFDPDDYDIFFFGDISPGASSTSFGVVGGRTYECHTWIEGKGAEGLSDLTVSVGQTKEVTITILEYDSTINFKFVDVDGNTLTDISSLSAFAASVEKDGEEYYNDFVFAQGSNGTATLSVLDGVKYEVMGFIEEDFGGGDDGGEFEDFGATGLHSLSDGTTYIQTFQMQFVTANANQAQTVSQTLKEADATIQVTVLDPDGNPEPDAWVTAMTAHNVDFGDTEEENHGWGDFIGGQPDENGVASLAVASGTTYEVMAHPFNAFEGDILPPPLESATPKEGQTVKLTMKSLEANWTTNISVSTADDANLDFSFCYAYNPELGIENFTDLPDGSGSMGIVKGSSWYFGCMGYAEDGFYRTAAETVYKPSGADGGSNSLELELTDAGTFYEEQSYSVDPTVANTINLEDGSTLRVPADVVTDPEGGNITITAGTATSYKVDDSAYPEEAWEFEMKDSTGEDIEDDFSSNITWVIPYDPEEMDIDEDTISGSTYNEQRNNWEPPASYQLDEEENTLSVSMAHFSKYALTGNLGLSSVGESSKPKKPRALKAKKIKKKSARLTWKKPKGATSITKYRVQVRKCKNVVKKKCKRTRQFQKKKAKWRKIAKTKKLKKTKQAKKVKKLKKGTYYQFRVRAINNSNKSKWSKWKRFKTKGISVTKK